MVNKVEYSDFTVYNDLLAKVTPKVRVSIEQGNLTDKDISEIAKAVIVSSNEDGSYSISKNLASLLYPDPNYAPGDPYYVLEDQMKLIREVCETPLRLRDRIQKRKAEDKLESGEKRARFSEEDKNEQVEIVRIVRRSKKNLAETPKDQNKQEESKPRINEIGDIFSIESNTPTVLLGIMADYLQSSAIVDFINEGKPIPQYLKDNLEHLDLYSSHRLTFSAFQSLITQFRNLKSVHFPFNMGDQFFEELSKTCPKIESLDLIGNNYVTNVGFDRAIQRFENLKHLNLNSSEIRDDGLINLSKFSATLQSLDLHGTNITGKFLSYINQSFEVLKKLRFTMCKWLQESNFIYISGKLPALEELIMSCAVTPKCLEYVVKGAKKLETLHLCDIADGDKVLEVIGNECLNLKELIIPYCKNISEYGIRSVFTGCQSLQELYLRCCNLCYIDDSTLKPIAEKSRNLTKLTLSCQNITDKGIESISKGCPNLKSIYLEFSYKVTDLGIFYLTQGVSDLQELIVDDDKCKLTSKTLEYIVKWKESLQILHLNASRLDDEDLTHLSSGFFALKSLSLKYNQCISDEGIRDFAKWFPSLRSLDLRGSNITDECVKYLKNLPKLSELILDYCNITNGVLSQFLDFPSLKRLSLFQCKKLTPTCELNKLRSSGIEVIALEYLNK